MASEIGDKGLIAAISRASDVTQEKCPLSDEESEKCGLKLERRAVEWTSCPQWVVGIDSLDRLMPMLREIGQIVLSLDSPHDGIDLDVIIYDYWLE